MMMMMMSCDMSLGNCLSDQMPSPIRILSLFRNKNETVPHFPSAQGLPAILS